jgi:hypothetical protein
MFRPHLKKINFKKCSKVIFLTSALLSVFSGAFYSTKSAAIEIAGSSEIEITAYAGDGQFEGQDYRYNTSFAITPEFFWEWNSGDSTLVVTPFVRVDENDDERSHSDLREFDFTYVNDIWEFHVGVRKVFWGVTEFNHLVDIVNQTDSIESFDGEEKLGQPMLSISRLTDWGIIDGFVLVGFRERNFTGEGGRLRGDIVVDENDARFENDREEKAIDFALRWSHSLDIFDVGVYWFSGTDRAPILEPSFTNSSLGLTPFYEEIDQIGIDAQATVDSWLLKFEGLHQQSARDEYLASQLGFEYTFYGLARSATDIGLLLEYGWDERGIDSNAIAQNDIYLGARLALNDSENSALLVGASYDSDFYTRSFLIEASRRINDRWTMSIEGLVFQKSNSNDPAAALNDDDRLQLTIERFF